MINNKTTFKYKGYIFWRIFDEPLDESGRTIKDYVTDYLKERFPGCIVIGKYFEFNKIDLYVVEEKLPVEIQATMPSNNKKRPEYSVSIANYEKMIKQQIEENIKTLGRCWFFMDAELLRYFQAGIKHWSSIQFDWFYKLMKEEKMAVFTIDYKGNIKPRNLEDFEWISKISTTCIIGENNDRRVLDRNKYDILSKVLNYYKVTQIELDKLGLEFRNNKVGEQDFKIYLMNTDDQRKKKVAYIFKGINNLYQINKIFDGDIIRNGHGLADGVHLGLFESEGQHIKNGGNRMKFTNESDLAQYHPGYIRHQEKWEEFKEKWLSEKQFECIIKGYVDYNWYKNAINESDLKPNESNSVSVNIDNRKNDRGLDVTIENKEETIKLNISPKTKQKTIEESWES